MYVNSFLKRLKRLPASVGRWTSRHRYEIVAFGIITGVGAFLRLYHLDTIPQGLHGDEALGALRARAILERQWAGPFDPYHAFGAPAGWEFWMAGVIKLFGDSLFAIRLSMALLATAAIPLAYLLFRLIDGKATAIIGSSLLALSSWHLMFSRQAWPPVTMTTTELLAGLVLLLALRSKKWWLFPIAGVVMALGLYMYNGYFYFLFGASLVIGGWLVSQRAVFGRAVLSLAVLSAAFFLTALPMLTYIQTHQDTYFRYPRSTSIFNSARFEGAESFTEQADVVLDSGRDFVQLLVFEGGRDLPMLAVATSVLLGLGFLIAVRRWREPGIALGLILFLMIPWAAILNPGGATIMLRRAIGVTPFIALLAALPLSAALRSKYLAAPHLKALVLVAAAAAVVSVGFTNLNFYFGGYATSPDTKVNYEVVQAANFLADLPEDQYVYFYSTRWPFDYEVRRYLAPDIEGEDRSGNWGSEFDLVPRHDRDIVYVFLGRQLGSSVDVERLYPGGQASELVDDDGTVVYRAYELPRSAGVDRELPEPGSDEDVESLSEGDGEEAKADRDEIRRLHLEQIKQALESYAQETGAYPDTNGQLQSLCAYRDLDAGCSLTTVLPELPRDPLGSIGSYRFSSDGTSFLLVAIQESTEGEQIDCPEHIARAANGEGLYCIQVP
ncbi:MAG: glycosyltransferase family 39 protein [Chloroflexi bacterium]|nr:glycosyltransferase family 39 protein [Chloroflexota bacterium]